MKKRVVIASTIIGILLLAVASPVLAAITHPDTLSIDSVQVYRHCLETDDQLYLIEYTIDYTGAYPDVYPSESTSEAWLARLMNLGTVELGVAAPYAYYQIGYGKGLVAIYFTEADAPPLWDTLNYSIQLTGNPTLDWGASVPETTVGTFDSWSDSTSVSSTQDELASKLLYLADILEIAWSVDMVETTPVGTRLTTYGEDYLTNVIPNLRTMCPGVFSSAMEPVDYYRRDVTWGTLPDTLRDQWDGTWLDTSDTATNLGVDKIWITGLIFIAALVAITYLITKKTASYKPIMLLVMPLSAIGARLGFVPLLMPVIIGVFCILAIGYVLFYQKTT